MSEPSSSMFEEVAVAFKECILTQECYRCPLHVQNPYSVHRDLCFSVRTKVGEFKNHFELSQEAYFEEDKEWRDEDEE